jgi:hypothetical protein
MEARLHTSCRYMHRRAPWWIVSVTSIESTYTRLISLVTQFGTSATVVDEPVAHLSHADAGRLVVANQL